MYAERRQQAMKASFLQKLRIMAVTVGSTLGISFYVLYLRLTKTYDRDHADNVLRWWSTLLLRAVKAVWQVTNPHGVTITRGRPHIIMSNHRSHYDIPLIYVSLPGSIRMLTKKELFRIPVWGRGMKAAEFISIDRRNHDQALKDMEEARRMMEDGIVLWVAPEGTRTRTGRLGEFKKGGFMLALQIGAVIIPVGIRGSEAIHRPESSDLHLGRSVQVHIGAPIDAAQYGREERDRLMADVRAAIVELSGEQELAPAGKASEPVDSRARS
jgi:1-acyl-sn-glycerol-3-phosphate acyltransferase